MILGTYIMALATVAALLSTIGYFIVARGNKAYVIAARWSYYLMTILVIFATTYLISLFLNDRFEFSYVAGYSSSDLSTNFKITSLWAGQEGSFLLWALLGVLLGLWVKYKAKEQLGWVMFFYLFGQLFLFVLMNISSPFALNQVVPADGRGLNPLLQNYWMQIHPPIMFLGYAATFIPFAFAMAALATKQYDRWVKLTFPWAIFSVCTLGAGIFLGGYWAYETLGWGGFWGWDPVENASLVPWLGSIALMHGMIIERHRGAFKKTNLFMAITTFLMVIYGTFLTRSGVLADFSVHSFVDLGLNAYLAVFLVGFTVISYGMLIYRAKSIKSSEPDKSPVSREFMVYLGMLFVILSAFLVLLGTSSPLLTKLLGDPSAVDISFYTITNMPIGIILGLILGLSGIFTWKASGRSELLRKLPLPVIISLVLVIAALFFGVTNAVHLLFIFTSGFAFIANLILLIKRIRRQGIKRLQADLTHTGFAIMLLGIIISAGYSSSEKGTLESGIQKDIQGFGMTFQGTHNISKDREEVHLEISRGETVFQANPVFVWSQQGLVRSPYIKKYLLYDLYISPEEIKELSASDDVKALTLAMDKTEKLDEYNITFKEFDTGSHMQGGAMSIGAVLEIESPYGKTSTITPRYIVTGAEEPEFEPAGIPDTDLNLFLLKLNADEGMVMLGITEADNVNEFSARKALIVEVTRKPLINLVWLGLIMIIFGSAISAYWRITEVK
ncbi:MAG: cytochrome c biogenesis protein CcsA [candidate division Zixibacteria bacterium]|nr:cytochrome c biogenesis protein CcsA [candidate division Zixibacteria bacterium]